MKPETPEYVRTLAKEMRKKPTLSENRLWQYLRRKEILGCKFYRQYPIGRYIADFCCPEKHLIIELDGRIHDTERQKEYDRIREKTLISESMNVLRFTNEQVLHDIDFVIKSIEEALLSSNLPLPLKGGGVGGEGQE